MILSGKGFSASVGISHDSIRLAVVTACKLKIKACGKIKSGLKVCNRETGERRTAERRRQTCGTENIPVAAGSIGHCIKGKIELGHAVDKAGTEYFYLCRRRRTVDRNDVFSLIVCESSAARSCCDGRAFIDRSIDTCAAVDFKIIEKTGGVAALTRI